MHSRALIAIAACLLSANAGFAAAPQDKVFTPDQVRADFGEMYEDLQEAHYDLYAFAPKPEFDALYRKTRASFDKPLTLFEIENRFELFAAAAHMGHTRIDFPYGLWADYLKGSGRAFPFDIRVVDGKAYVVRNHSGLDVVVPGDEIVLLNGAPMAQWLARTRAHVSAETDYMADSILEYDFPMYLWVELGDLARYDILFRNAGHLTVPGRTGGEMKAFDAHQPPALSLDKPLRDARILADSIGYLRPGPFYNAEAQTEAEGWDVSGFRRFIDDAFAKFNAAHTDRLIIDLRGNPGGDNLFSDVMVSWFATKPFRFFSQFKVRVSPESTAANRDRIEHDAIAAGPISRQYAELYAQARNGDSVDFNVAFAKPREGERFRGKVFLLVDRQSYSNTVAVAALVQDYGFGTILGEETSDMATTYGAMEHFTLPNTAIQVDYPKAHIVRPNGNLKSCGVVPDIVIPMPVVQTPADEVLARALVVARQH
jgi:hypothetical protein